MIGDVTGIARVIAYFVFVILQIFSFLPNFHLFLPFRFNLSIFQQKNVRSFGFLSWVIAGQRERKKREKTKKIIESNTSEREMRSTTLSYSLSFIILLFFSCSSYVRAAEPILINECRSYTIIDGEAIIEIDILCIIFNFKFFLFFIFYI